MKIDLHVHTALASSCSMLSLPGLFSVLRARGVDGVCITDHERYDGFRAAARMGRDIGVAVFMGIEIKTLHGDMLVYSEEELDFSGFRVPDPGELIDFVHGNGGICVAAHPYRSSAPGLGGMLDRLEGLDGIEVLNGNCTKEQNDMALEAARRLNVFATGGSDSHWEKSVGMYYTEFPVTICSQKQFIHELRLGNGVAAGPGTFWEG